MFYEQSASWRFPMVEVALHREPEVLLNGLESEQGSQGLAR